MKTVQRLALLTTVAVVGASAGGCALAPVAALGVVGNISDIGNTAFTAGTEVFSSGKLESVEFCTLQQGDTAVRWMLNDLRLRVTKVESDKTSISYYVVDENGSKVEFDLRRRTAAICQFRVNVGWFGSEAYSRLLLKSIRARLPLTTRYSTTAPSDPVDLFKSRTSTIPGVPSGIEVEDVP